MTKKDVKQGQNIIADTIVSSAANLVTKVQKTAANYMGASSYSVLTA